MSLVSVVRAAWNRVLYGDVGSETLAKVNAPVHIQQALEGAVTYVAEFQPTGYQAGVLVQGQDVVIDNVRLSTEYDDGYQTRRVFTGVVDPYSAASFENEVTVTCTGNLRKLRKSRSSDYSLTGKTDQQAVKDVLTYCGIAYDAADIAGDGYVLGAVKPVTWKKRQTGAELIQELDNVFGYATIELGDGRVVRFPYSRVPSEYDDLVYGTKGTVKDFRRGTQGLTFYENERERGSMDEIKNHWRVAGVSWEGAEGAADEGCNYQVVAEAFADNDILGAGVYQSDEFSSDFIQSELLAKKIASRLMRYNNRRADVIRIVAGNDPKVGVGHLVGVRDQAYAIDLDTTQRYLVLNCSRDGDFMTIDCIGGAPGEVGTITSGIDKCCGTQREDGTCDDTGTNPGTPDPNTPTVPDIPDIDICDPITNPNCIPLDEDEEGADPNLIDPIYLCTTEGSFLLCDPDDPQYDTCEEGAMLTGSCVGSAPIDVCATSSLGTEWFTKIDSDSGAGYSCVCEVHVPWRVNSGTPYFRVGFGESEQIVNAVAHVGTNISGTIELVWNEETDPDLQTQDTDHVLASPLIHSVSGLVTFNTPGSILVINFYEYNGDGVSYSAMGAPVLNIYADPGLHITPVGGDAHDLGLVVSTENEGPILLGDALPNTSTGVLQSNNGGYVIDSEPAAMGSALAFNVSFDETFHNGWGKTTVFSGIGSGHIVHNDYIEEGNPFPGEPSDTPASICVDKHPLGHALKINMVAGGIGSFDAPAVLLENLVIGHTTCEQNPDYVDEIEDDST